MTMKKKKLHQYNFYIDLKLLKRCPQYLENWQLFVMRVCEKKKEFVEEKDNNWQLFITRER